ncbi:MAG: extracellular solute-binding protein [Acetobacteraceae bacterium]|nr:extracellular solute-binding protein [Acetobacteraceae bacterium]
MSHMQTTRRGVLGGAAAIAAAGAGLGRAKAAEAVGISIIDAAGNLALTRPGFEAFAKANPGKVNHITYTSATAPEIPGKLMAQQAAGKVDIDLILGGNDVLAAGIAQKLWEPLFPNHAAALPSLDILSPMAKRLQSAAENQALVVAVCPGGPILEYMPDAVKTCPTTAEELLAWAKQNPKKFMYARPANSGPGRAFMMGLPYILGDSNPRDPNKGWDKSWAYMEELGKYIEYYPTGTGATMKELAEGTRSIIASHVGWDINPRALGTVPKEAKIQPIKGFHWIGDSHFMCVPKGLTADKLALVLELVTYMMQPAAQAYTFDKGYFYPGPARAGVTIDQAPKESRDVIAEYGRPEYAKLIADNPIELPLDAEPMVYAFQRWDQQVGAKVGK